MHSIVPSKHEILKILKFNEKEIVDRLIFIIGMWSCIGSFDGIKE